MTPDLHHPTLRPIDARHIEHMGAEYFLLRDPQNIAEEQLLVPAFYAPILASMDGSMTLDEIVTALHGRYNLVVPRSAVTQLAEVLDENYLLDSIRFRRRLSEVTAEYRAARFRPPALAGAGYPADPRELWQQMQEFLEQTDGVTPATVSWARPVGILSPHIDYERGHEVYGRVWKRAAIAAAEAELVIIVGTDHHGDDAFTLTRQNYATPYGVLPTDAPIVNRLADALGEEAAFAGELRHRGEHSLELVLTWLHHMREGKPVQVVPILVGSLARHLHNGASPRTDSSVERVIAILREEMEGRKALVIASGDLAHVGTAFDQPPLTQVVRDRVHAEDRRILADLARGDADAFYATIRRVHNRFNVCGVTPIYLTLRLIGEQPGEEMGYRVCPADDADGSAVTVAGVYFGAGGNGKVG